MKTLEIDREGECHFRVSWPTINGVRARLFDSRHAAESFAYAKMGKRGCVISTLDMTAEQLEAHRARIERAQRFMAGLEDASQAQSKGDSQ